MVSLSIVLKLKAKMDLVFLWAATLLHVILFVVSCLQQGALERRHDRSATRLEEFFHRKVFLSMLDLSNLTRRKAYKTRVQGICHCVENVSINCPCLKQNGYVCTLSTQNLKARFIQKLSRENLRHKLGRVAIF